MALTDDPGLGERDLEEQDLLHASEALDNTAVFEIQRPPDDPRACSEQQTHDRRDDPDFRELPLDRLTSVRCLVVGDRDRCDIGEDGEEAARQGQDEYGGQARLTR